MSFSKLLYLSGIDFGIQWLLWGVAALLKTEKFYDLAGIQSNWCLNIDSKYFHVSYVFRFINVRPASFAGISKILEWSPKSQNTDNSNPHLGCSVFLCVTNSFSLYLVTVSFVFTDWACICFHEFWKKGTTVASMMPKITHLSSLFIGLCKVPIFSFQYKLFLSHFLYCAGVWVIVTLLPSLLMVMKSKQPTLNAQDWIGWTMWVVGFVTEVLADYQKSQFRSDPANAGKFINTGLWSLSRHPNYFGEILLWSGLFVSASSSFTKWWYFAYNWQLFFVVASIVVFYAKHFAFFSNREYLTILSPMFLGYLITRMSGIPPLESYGLKKWGHLPEYKAYLENTPVLVPFFWM